MSLEQLPRSENLALTAQNTEYSLAIPPAVRAFDFQAREGRDVRVAFVVDGTFTLGKYFTLKSGNIYYKEPVEHREFSIYFRDPSNAGTTIEFILWEEVG